jgi:hypothetical protein
MHLLYFNCPHSVMIENPSEWPIQNAVSVLFLQVEAHEHPICVPYVTVLHCNSVEYFAVLDLCVVETRMSFYFRILFMGFLPHDTSTMTIVHILVTVHNMHTLTIFHDSIFFPPLLALHMKWHWSVHPFSNSFVVSNFIILIIFFLSEIDSLQWYLLKWNSFT